MTTHTKNQSQNSGHRFSERIARPRVLLLLAILAIGSLMLSFYLGTRYAATGPDPTVQAKTVIQYQMPLIRKYQSQLEQERQADRDRDEKFKQYVQEHQ